MEFADAVGVFEDDYAFYQQDKRDYDEERYIAIGMDVLGRVLFVVYTYRQADIRIISARVATKGEQRSYEQYRFF